MAKNNMKAISIKSSKKDLIVGEVSSFMQNHTQEVNLKIDVISKAGL